MYTETLTLANGVKIPQLGLGTWFIDDANAAEAVKAAAKLGYSHFDTAQAYGNERGVGEGVRSCGVPREELFVVSKVAAEHKTYEAAKASIDGRREMPSVFDGRTMEHPLTHLRLTGVQQFESGAVWLRYAL